MSLPKRKGSAHERALANKLWDMGLAVLRGCSSGGGVRKRFVPDIVAMGPGFVLIFEAKYRSERNPIRIEEEKIARLLEFAQRAKGDAYVAIKFRGDDWRFLPVTSKEGLLVKPEDLGNAYTLEQLINKYMSKSLMEYLK
ncbi:Holliday junction resolvase Hjc [Vulcanisaeta souniana]|uniref:Crossover junction endodeoxyribonuclease Hjc n=1 Tax=Vulcanisaeta souniana JCM 11219 TaxID=1293586 RepID=A0A830DY05_9CREN|nr:Holliday junction resolvase Hjc [Vulcanisaeta souniana]BDR92132.1 Holliday junction DNA helicase [Vulcanisaeta souniana JCM 11219]GGI67690.1 Holliday junction DNA helicase [Vulcanisaeta souniana JCM 11219]